MAMGRFDLGMQLAAVRPEIDAARLHKPLLARVGTADQVVLTDEGSDINRPAAGPKLLLSVPGASHFGGYRVDPTHYQQTVLGFLARTIS